KQATQFIFLSSASSSPRTTGSRNNFNTGALGAKHATRGVLHRARYLHGSSAQLCASSASAREHDFCDSTMELFWWTRQCRKDLAIFLNRHRECVLSLLEPDSCARQMLHVVFVVD